MREVPPFLNIIDGSHAAPVANGAAELSHLVLRRYETELYPPMQLAWEGLQAALWYKLGVPLPEDGQPGRFSWPPFTTRGVRGGGIVAGSVKITGLSVPGYESAVDGTLGKIYELRELIDRRDIKASEPAVRVLPESETMLQRQVDSYAGSYLFEVNPTGGERYYYQIAAPSASLSSADLEEHYLNSGSHTIKMLQNAANRFHEDVLGACRFLA